MCTVNNFSFTPGEGNAVLDDNDLMVLSTHLGPSGGPSRRSGLLVGLDFPKLTVFVDRLEGLLLPFAGWANRCPYKVTSKKNGLYVYQALTIFLALGGMHIRSYV